MRAVEYGEVTRIGSSRPITVDVRIVAATNEDLPSLAERGEFRADLLDRLSFEVITLPPLRAREGDIIVIADFFARRMAAELMWDEWPGFSESVIEQLEAHSWPGNVRELRNVIERAVYRWDDWKTPVGAVVFDPFASPWAPRASSRPQAEPTGGDAACRAKPVFDFAAVTDLRAAVDGHERAIVESALDRHRWNQRRAAEALGLSYDQLRHCIRKHGLNEAGSDSGESGKAA